LLRLLHEQAQQAGWSPAERARAASADGALAVVDFIAEAEQCPHCGAPMQIHKSQTRLLSTLQIGTVRVREVRKRCSASPAHPIAASQRLAQLVPRHQRYGYDVIVAVGLARYHRHLQREEIRAELRLEHGIVLSEGSISELCNRFLHYLEALHRRQTPALRAAMQAGYPLHIDATSESGKGGLFLCLDGWRGWVLHAVKIASENEAELRPAIEQTVSAFGKPVAFVHDLGGASAKALEPYREQGIVDLVCHYHFLGAIGNKLFDTECSLLRDLLRQSKVRGDLRELLRAMRKQCTGELYQGKLGQGRLREALPALILWVLEGEGRKDSPYPFTLPHLSFYQRCGQLQQQAERWLPLPRSHVERRVLKQALALVAALNKIDRFAWAVPRLERSWEVFAELRDILRLTDAELPRGDRRTLSNRHFPALEADRLRDIEEITAAYHEEIRQRVVASQAQTPHPVCPTPEAIVLDYLDRYRDRLFGHPVARDNLGNIVAIVERTNNVAEHFFGADKQKLRRRLGRAHLGRDLEDQPAQAALAANLRHIDYVQIVCGTLEQLPRAFVELDREGTSETTPLQRSNKDYRLIKRIRALVADDKADPETKARETARTTAQNNTLATVI
jgi:hypothetical protein